MTSKDALGKGEYTIRGRLSLFLLSTVGSVNTYRKGKLRLKHRWVKSFEQSNWVSLCLFSSLKRANFSPPTFNVFIKKIASFQLGSEEH